MWIDNYKAASQEDDKKKNKVDATFNVFLPTGVGPKNIPGILMTGFRVMSGMIWPPTAKFGGAWHSILTLPEETARLIYLTVKTTTVGDKLLPEDIAIAPLLLARKDAPRFLKASWQDVKLN